MLLAANLYNVDSELYITEKSQGVEQHIFGFHWTVKQKVFL